MQDNVESNGTIGGTIDAVVSKLPLSFAAVTTAAVPDISKEVSVSA